MRAVILDHETRRSLLALSVAGSHDKATGALVAWFAVVSLARVCRSYAIIYPASESILFASARVLTLVHLNVRFRRQREPFALPFSSLIALRFTSARAMIDHLRVQSGEVGLPRYIRNQADRSSPQPPRHADSANMIMLRRLLPGYRACHPS